MKKLLLLVLLSCDDATMVVVDNGYADATNVDKVWWAQTLIPDMVDGATESPAYRTVPAKDYAYALIDRGADFIAVRTTAMVTIDRGATLHITLSPSTVTGDCANGAPLTQAEADLITQSIFRGEFAGATYDAATCKTARPAGPDGGVDGGAD